MREYRIQKETTTETVETVAKPTAIDDSKQKDRNSETVDNVAKQTTMDDIPKHEMIMMDNIQREFDHQQSLCRQKAYELHRQ